MFRKLIKDKLPSMQELKAHPHLQFLGKWLHDPNLWHFNRKSVAGATAIGLFCCFLPMPFQMVVSSAFAVLLRRNLPIAAALVWLTNPATMPPVFYVTYMMGIWITGTAPIDLSADITVEWMEAQAAIIWWPFLVGSIATGIIAAIIGYFTVLAAWRWHIWNHIAKRRAKRKKVN